MLTNEVKWSVFFVETVHSDLNRYVEQDSQHQYKQQQ